MAAEAAVCQYGNRRNDQSAGKFKLKSDGRHRTESCIGQNLYSAYRAGGSGADRLSDRRCGGDDAASAGQTNSGLQLVPSGDGYSLQFVLNEARTRLEEELQVGVSSQTTAPFRLDVSEADIQVEFYDADENPITGLSENAVSKTAGCLDFTAECIWNAQLTEGQQLTVVDGIVPQFTVEFHVDSANTGESGVLYTQEQGLVFSVVLPQGIRLPEGELTVSGNQILCGENVLAEITGLPDDVQISAAAGQTETSALSITVKRQRLQSEETEPLQELTDIQGSITFSSGGFSVAEDAAFAQQDAIKVTLAVTSMPMGAGEPVSAQADTSFPVQTAEAESPEGVAIDSYREAFSQNIFWLDNHDEANTRPTTGNYPLKLHFSVDGGQMTELTAENMGTIGLQDFPEINVEEDGTGSYRLSIGANVLPEKITKTDQYGDAQEHTITWSILPQEVAGYELVEVTDENLSQYPAVSESGWYYVLLMDFQFRIHLRWGTLGSAPGMTQAIYDQFNLRVVTSQTELIYNFNDLKDAISVATDPSADPQNPTSGSMNIANVWKYNLDGSLIHYTVEEIEGGDGTIRTDNLDEGDYFKISYDNTAAPNFGSVTDRIHNGGTLYLTLTGTKTYDSEKVWLDERTEESRADRPGGRLQLWRYRAGESYTTASPVYDAEGNFLELDLDTASDEQEIRFENLEKYDPEGYEYFYVIKEYLDTTTPAGEEAVGYEQVFGKVEADGTITDRLEIDGELTDTQNPDLRDDLDNCLYNGGTLSNRIMENIEVRVDKIWEAAAFQADFEDVTVVLSLQARTAGSDDPWQDTGKTVTMDDFYAEKLSDSVRMSVNRYDHLGREREYRWIESAVYQGEADPEKNLLQANADGSGSFTLSQNGRDIRYRSQPVVQEDGSTRITNSIANTIDYDIEKIWLDENGQDITSSGKHYPVTFYLFRTTDGTDMEKVAEVTLDGTADQEKFCVNEDLEIYFQKTEAWKATVSPLDEFDEKGRQYEYSLIEVGGNGHPDMETKLDEEGNYETIVRNHPGEGNWIVVRKEWIDNSDITHRQPVTVTVYSQENDEKIASTVLGDDGIWYDWVAIGTYEPKEVYVLETEVGETAVPYPDGQTPTMPEEYDGLDDEEYTEVQFETEYHQYAATYSSGTVEDTQVVFYRVSNRRLGNIDLTVDKIWTDGDGERRGKIQDALEQLAEEASVYLALKLDFADTIQQQEYYEISTEGWQNADKGDTVIIGNRDNAVAILDEEENPADSIQIIDLDAQEDVSYTFFHLPKYDRSGTAVRYSVEEVWIDRQGNILSKNELQKKYPQIWKLYREYQVAYEETDYVVGQLHEQDHHLIEVENRLQGSKDVRWYKEWNDDYIYNQGQRPDIYLNIYQTYHTSEDPQATTTVLYETNYKWNFHDADDDPEGIYDQKYFWYADIENLSKYDEFGYEIIYYATEHMQVNGSDFDYQTVQYVMDLGDTEVELGTADELNVTEEEAGGLCGGCFPSRQQQCELCSAGRRNFCQYD